MKTVTSEVTYIKDLLEFVENVYESLQVYDLSTYLQNVILPQR